jgi:hypothetical protein
MRALSFAQLYMNAAHKLAPTGQRGRKLQTVVDFSNRFIYDAKQSIRYVMRPMNPAGGTAPHGTPEVKTIAFACFNMTTNHRDGENASGGFGE